MEIKLFTDLIDALGGVVSGLKAIVNLPKAERVKNWQTLNEIYRLIEIALNMVVIRLSGMLLIEQVRYIGHNDLKRLRRPR